MIAWRRATASNLRRNLLKPVLAGVVVLAVPGCARRRRASPPALLMFGFAAFVLGRGRAGAVARRARPAGDVGRGGAGARWSRWCAATAAATAATSCTRASPCCSSASRRRRASRTSARCSSRRARARGSARYEVTYVKPTAELQAAPNGRLERIDLGAQLRVARDGERRRRRCAPSSRYFPSTAPFLGPISRFFEGEATSEVGLKAGWRRDVWTAIAPDIGALRPRHRGGRQGLLAARS